MLLFLLNINNVFIVDLKEEEIVGTVEEIAMIETEETTTATEKVDVVIPAKYC